MLRLKTAWQADTQYDIIVSNPGQAIYTGYFWIDPLRYDYAVNRFGVGVDGTNSRGNRNWFGTEMESMFYQYSEGRFRTHVLNVQLSADYFRNFTPALAANAVQQTLTPLVLQFVCATVPQSFIRTSAAAASLVTDAGAVIMNGPDYYSALSKMPGAKSFILPTDGSANTQKNLTMTIDGYEHTGSCQSIIATRTWAPANAAPTLTVTHPDPPARQVFLFAFRFRQLSSNEAVTSLGIRAAFRMDQHMEFCDKVSSWPYLLTGNAN